MCLYTTQKTRYVKQIKCLIFIKHFIIPAWQSITIFTALKISLLKTELKMFLKIEPHF